MAGIVISYRRTDSEGTTGRIYDRLVTKFGRDRVFVDIDDIPIAVDFRDHLRKVYSRTTIQTTRYVTNAARGIEALVKWYNPTKGYRFLTTYGNKSYENRKDVFIHISEVERAGITTLIEGQKISFDIVLR